MEYVAILIVAAVFAAVGYAIYATVRKKQTGSGPSGSEALGDAAKKAEQAARDQINRL